jgi:hypothetical protein
VSICLLQFKSRTQLKLVSLQDRTTVYCLAVTSTPKAKAGQEIQETPRQEVPKVNNDTDVQRHAAKRLHTVALHFTLAQLNKA